MATDGVLLDQHLGLDNLMGGLWYNFLRTWLGDPGFINPPKEDKLRAVVELAEKNEFSVAKLCTTCLVVRPLRSKHCSVCGKCVAVMDHHCPFTGNCVGRANHRFFVGYLVWLSMSGIGAVHTGLTYLGALYQISVVAMTTNERINQHRYGHFRGEDGTRLSPFHKGFVEIVSNSGRWNALVCGADGWMGNLIKS
ncbi:palmitoyltransferase ZDHHC17-like [Paramacrobiotus metropolitanus]|uniref:palmitoyltransferase ZDHHC17-like n=1 Tax=Paramacrobiotus metropolitanus TaxID=2943436 RepID=UPI0024457993|nr:palmitoyltransferase ZDHHC17-like [Paramacrobiotus metropolitanus]